MRIPFRAVTGLAVLSVLALAGCAAPAVEPDAAPSADAHTGEISHVHAIVIDPASGDFLLGTHEGIFAATADGHLGGRVGDAVFDAMGLVAVGDALLASGHPGSNTPAEWGAPNIGIIRSADGAQSWEPVTFNGEKDFHALTSAPGGIAYGLATDNPVMLVSTDAGNTWTPTGLPLEAVSLAAMADGRVIAATAQGLLESSDGAVSFTPWVGAPMLYTLSSSPNHSTLVGVDVDGVLWVVAEGSTEWRESGKAEGRAQAVTVTDGGTVAVFDDGGFRVIPPAS